MAKLKTGRHTSAMKENRKTIKRTAQNKSMRSSIKTIAGKVEDAVAAKNKTLASDLLRSAFALWDKAAKTNVIHKNTANNQKARLSKLVHSLPA